MERYIPFGEKLATLVVDGTEKEINGGIYGEKAVLVLTDAFQKPPADFFRPWSGALPCSFGGRGRKNLRKQDRPTCPYGGHSDRQRDGWYICSQYHSEL